MATKKSRKPAARKPATPAGAATPAKPAAPVRPKAPSAAAFAQLVAEVAELGRRQGHIASALLGLRELVTKLPPLPEEVSVAREGFLAGLAGLKREIGDG